jgi:hypothetical protein
VVSEEFRSSSWDIPYLLKAFYRAHDGFGPMDHASSFWFEDSILPCAALTPLTRYVHFGQDVVFNPDDCLMFYPDGGGNGYCFQRSAINDPSPRVVFWACGNKELAEAPAFLALLKRTAAPGQEN